MNNPCVWVDDRCGHIAVAPSIASGIHRSLACPTCENTDSSTFVAKADYCRKNWEAELA